MWPFYCLSNFFEIESAYLLGVPRKSIIPWSNSLMKQETHYTAGRLDNVGLRKITSPVTMRLFDDLSANIR